MRVHSIRATGGAFVRLALFLTFVVGIANAPARSEEAAAFLEIYEIQGSDRTSPFQGDTVRTRNNVVTAVAPDGFVIQTPAARTDGDPDTSDGLFVFTGRVPAVAAGDLVDVTGKVNEFFGLTELSNAPVVVVKGRAALPPPVAFDAATPSPDPESPSCGIAFECYEGMLVQLTGAAVSGPSQRFFGDPIAEVHVVAGPRRTFREPGVAFPGLMMPSIPTWDGNPEIFELDPDRLGLPNRIIPAGSIVDAVGVLGFEFGGYELWPTALTVTPAPLPRPVRPREPGEFTIGTLNLFRFFDDIDDPPSLNPQGQVRGDRVVSTAEYQTRRAKLAAYILDLLGAPDILGVQEVEKREVLQILAEDIALRDAGVIYGAYLEEGNDRGTIDVGFLVRNTVQVERVTQLGAGEILAFDGSLLHDRPPLLLEGSYVGNGAPFPVRVMVVHGRSLLGLDDPNNAPRVRRKRLAQAQSIARKVQAIQSADPDVGLVVTGDFNAFQFTDGFVDVVGQIRGDFDPAENLLSGPDLVNPNLKNQIESLAAAERYSFIFRGNAQALDHVLSSRALDPWIRGAEYGRGNADAAAGLIQDDATPLRASDHDGLVLFLMSDSDADGVPEDLDVCAGTDIPESVPTVALRVNRFALVDTDDIFDTRPPVGRGPRDTYTLSDTAGCSCEQILEALGLGRGHEKFGCSNEAMRDWIALVGPLKR